MTEQQLTSLTSDATGNFQQLITAVQSTRFFVRTGMDTRLDQNHIATISDVISYQKQYQVRGHDVFDKVKRPDKPIMDKDDRIVRIESPNRIALPFQQIIASRHAAFLCANPIQRVCLPESPDEERMLNAVNKVWNDSKLDFDTLDMAERWMSETEVAELWFTEPLGDDDPYWEDVLKGNYRLRMRLLANSLGDRLFPCFDDAGNLIAFGREWYSFGVDASVHHFDVYTDANTYLGTQDGSGWQVKEEKSFCGKIPVIYYSYPGGRPVWDNAQFLIDRLEKKTSNHADTNDRFDSPILLLTGTPESMPDAASTGKVFKLENGADAKYLIWNSAPESTKLEIENLEKYIYSLTDTPDISFENLKTLARASDFDAEAMFMSAHLKAAKHAGYFGKGIQRRINFLKAAIGLIDISLPKATTLPIKPVFSYFTIKNIAGVVNYLHAATGGEKVLSQQSAVDVLQGYMGGVGAEEYQRILDEQQTAIQQQQQQFSSPEGLNAEMGGFVPKVVKNNAA